MPYAYVYAPVSGSISGLNYYCACVGGSGVHYLCLANCNCFQSCNGWSSPVDIRTSGSTPRIFLYRSSGILSVRTCLNFSCCNGSADDYGRVVIVELFAQYNAQCPIGSVKFGHVGSPKVEHGRVYNLAPGVPLELGIVLPPPNPPRACYTGPHIHYGAHWGRDDRPWMLWPCHRRNHPDLSLVLPVRLKKESNSVVEESAWGERDGFTDG